MGIREIFKDKKLDSDFKQNGYVIINLLDELTAKNLYEKVIQFDSGVKSPFYTSLWSSNADYRKEVDNLIQEEIGTRVLPYFHNYKPLFGDLLVKNPSLLKDFPLHQDWTFVEEDLFTSVYVWCPLQNVNYFNGNLQVLEKSHRFLDKIRGANIQVSYEAIKSQIQKKYLQNIPLKAGQAIIFNQALLHASPPNRSLKTRISMGLLFLPSEATIYHYYYNKSKQKIQRITANKDFFMEYGGYSDFQNALKNNDFFLNEKKFNIEDIHLEKEELTFTNFIEKLIAAN